jgi:Protein of unknown function (DUF3298)/Deacetylase PdaC
VLTYNGKCASAKLPAIVLIVAVLSLVAGCKRAASPKQTTAATQPSPEQQSHHPVGGSAIPVAQTKYFKGSIGSALDLQMKLVQEGDNLKGNYFYQKVGTKIDLKGTVDKEGNLFLEEFDASGKQTGVFKGLWKMDEYGIINLVGNWSKPNSDKKTAFSIYEEPIEFSGTTELVAKTIKETNKKLNYEIDAEYPQVVGAADNRFDKFNQESRNIVTRRVAEFKKHMAEAEPAEESVSDSSSGGSDLGAGYTVGLARDNLISIKFDIGGYYKGAAHPNSFSEVLNYDVTNGKIIKLGDLFAPNSKFLQTISAYSIKDLKSQAKAGGANSMLTDETIQDGAGADPKNFKSWNITKKGLEISFDSYQVGPYAAGPQRVVIPYSALKTIIKPDGPLAGFVK